MWSGRDFGTHQTRLAIGTSNFVTYFRADLHICHYFILPVLGWRWDVEWRNHWFASPRPRAGKFAKAWGKKL